MLINNYRWLLYKTMFPAKLIWQMIKIKLHNIAMQFLYINNLLYLFSFQTNARHLLYISFGFVYVFSTGLLLLWPICCAATHREPWHHFPLHFIGTSFLRERHNITVETTTVSWLPVSDPHTGKCVWHFGSIMCYNCFKLHNLMKYTVLLYKSMSLFSLCVYHLRVGVERQL